VVKPLPEYCGIAFKEWAIVCDALLAGRQTIILRKGGISEGTAPGVFLPEHSEFWLYPTWVHQAEQGVRVSRAPTSSDHRASGDGSLLIRALAQVDVLGYIESEEALPPLEEHHILTAETVLKRFHYRKPGLWVLVARVWRREPAFSIAVTPQHAGCKTWVVLKDALATSGLSPVFDDDGWAERRRSLEIMLGAAIS
jgi:hypothetical protein